VTWQRTVPLSQVADVFNGKTPSKAEQRSFGHPVLKIRDVTELGEFRGSFESFVDDEFASTHASKKARVGDTLILNAAHNSAYVASKTFRVGPEASQALATGEWLIVRPAPEQLNPDYAHHFLNSFGARTAIRDMVKGIHLYPKDVLRLRVPVPPLWEQQRIAEVLDRTDALRARRRAALAKLETLTQAIFLDMFGDPAGHGWKMTTVRGIVGRGQGSIRTGPFGSQLLHSEFTESGIAVLGIDNAVSNEFRWGERRFISAAKYAQLRRYTVRPGDVLITIMGTCGRCAVVPMDIPTAINTKHLCCITVDRSKCLPQFLHAYFLMHPIAAKYLRQTAKGAIMSGLNMGIIQAMPIPVPPLQAQARFVLRLSAVDRLKSEHRASLAELDTLFASLQHRAFRGEL